MRYAMQMGAGLAVSLLLVGVSMAQSPSRNPTGPTPAASSSQRAVSLAETGHCTEALPLLRKSIHQVTDPNLKKRIGLLGLNCAMTQKGSYDALEFLTVLQHEFPRDPEVLYAAVHALSDLSLRASKDLVREAPFSYQVYLLNAEALETQGKTAEAATEYRRIIAMNPLLPGMHARLGRVLLSGQPTPEAVAEAKKNFEEELAIDPNNAAVEYVLGELLKDENNLPSAVQHYTRATKINPGFAEAYLGLGSALVAQQQFAEAIPPLEKYEQLAPDSPTGHYQLALAYNGAGRKDDANREAALQREAAKNLEQIKRRVSEGLESQQPHQ
jgi:tetratricopeptide (TPR) repeat protein